MKVIDADAHVIENESTWDYMLESERQFKPKVVGATSAKDPFDYWMVDGRVIPRNNVGRDLPVAAREMSDLSARVKHMDELGIDCQVIYPTFFHHAGEPAARHRPRRRAQLQPLDGRYRQETAGSFSLGPGAAAAKHGASRRRAEVRQGERRLRRLHARSGSRAQSQRSLFLSIVRTSERAWICRSACIPPTARLPPTIFLPTIPAFRNSSSR